MALQSSGSPPKTGQVKTKSIIDYNHDVKLRRAYKHYKGGRYIVLGFCIQESTGITQVIYSDIDCENEEQGVYCRPVNEWFDEVKDSEGNKTTRFKLITKK